MESARADSGPEATAPVDCAAPEEPYDRGAPAYRSAADWRSGVFAPSYRPGNQSIPRLVKSYRRSWWTFAPRGRYRYRIARYRRVYKYGPIDRSALYRSSPRLLQPKPRPHCRAPGALPRRQDSRHRRSLSVRFVELRHDSTSELDGGSRQFIV
ncbi:uncharacterized protein LOC106707752 [Papilio machaon]|uniref:uncharacterized protein LOC106707752 n=1 Tax=Papilio machaon TaxID=76193 RepID=UPI0006EAF91F|nr:uncharacterized protein LOC106707752 [Papilio machaon]